MCIDCSRVYSVWCVVLSVCASLCTAACLLHHLQNGAVTHAFLLTRACVRLHVHEDKLHTYLDRYIYIYKNSLCTIRIKCSYAVFLFVDMLRALNNLCRAPDVTLFATDTSIGRCAHEDELYVLDVLYMFACARYSLTTPWSRSFLAEALSLLPSASPSSTHRGLVAARSCSSPSHALLSTSLRPVSG